MSVVHEVKSWRPFFGPIVGGERTHELRRNDRGYQVGDVLRLLEFDPETETYTGRRCDALITSMTSDEIPCAVSAQGLAEGFCILSIRVISN